MSDLRGTVLAEVFARRVEQNQRWGGPAHDDRHRDADWCAFVVRYLGRAAIEPFDRATFRAAMVDVAAVALAATEARLRRLWPGYGEETWRRRLAEHKTGRRYPLNDPNAWIARVASHLGRRFDDTMVDVVIDATGAIEWIDAQIIGANTNGGNHG